MRERMNTEEFVARVAAPLKDDVSMPAGFEARVMRAVEEAARPWWSRRRTFSLSPIGGVALAAGFAGLMFLAGRGTAGVRTDTAASAVVAQVPDTVHVVRFVFRDPNARSVAIVGDFNAWSTSATPLVAHDVDGVWSISVPLTAGRHEYAFVVDGERWVADPFAHSRRDEFGQESSFLRVGDDGMRGA
jgi:hypothetical protein